MGVFGCIPVANRQANARIVPGFPRLCTGMRRCDSPVSPQRRVTCTKLFARSIGVIHIGVAHFASAHHFLPAPYLRGRRLCKGPRTGRLHSDIIADRGP